LFTFLRNELNSYTFDISNANKMNYPQQTKRYMEGNNHVVEFKSNSGLTISRYSSKYMPYVILSSGNTLIGFETEKDFNGWVNSFGKVLDYVIITKQ